jgi:predicted  nucleic acid-binding Zn-ribbon protein
VKDKMPHQCLKCGKVYKDSKYVIEGCPECGGKSFYYTKKPLDEKKRKELLKEIEEETIKGERIDEIIEEIKRKKEKAIKEAEKLKDRVESISVREVGEYEINVKRLMEEGSIIVYKDGAYFIYLPSLFGGKK